MGAKFFLFDCETTGLSEQDHTLLTIFGLALNGSLDVIDSIDLKIKPNSGIYHVDTKAMIINKINLIEHDRKAVSERRASNKLSKFLYQLRFKKLGYPPEAPGPLVPVGKNAGFDIRFLKKLLGEEEYTKYFSSRILDISSIVHFQQLCNILPPNLDDSLPGLAEYFNFSTKNLHNAEFDAKLTLKVLKRLIQNNNVTKGK